MTEKMVSYLPHESYTMERHSDLVSRMMLVAPDSGRVTANSRPHVVTSGPYEGQVTTLTPTSGTLPFPDWAKVSQDEVVADGDLRLVMVTYPNRFDMGLIDPRLCPPVCSIGMPDKPVRSFTHEEQQAARDAAWDERRRVIAYAEFCANAHRPTRPDIADAILAFGKEIEDEEHL